MYFAKESSLVRQKLKRGKERLKITYIIYNNNILSITGRHVWRKGEVCTRFWLGNLRERDHWGDQDVDGRTLLRWIFRKWEGVVGTEWSWLRIGTGDGHL